MNQQEAIAGLLALGYSQRKIAAELGVHRLTVKRYADLKCTISQTGKVGRRSECAQYGERIREKYVSGLTLERIHQDLRIDHGFTGERP